MRFSTRLPGGHLWLRLCALILGACSEEQRSDGGLSQSCPMRTPASKDGETRIAHPDKPTSCTVVMMSCNYCTYKDGQFSHSGSEPCGICLSFSTQ